MPCNKREPGTGCGALHGYNRMHAIFGASDSCIAVHPSDMCVALAALDASVNITGNKKERKILFTDFHRLPGNTPQKDNTLEKGELITSIEIPSNNFNTHYHYSKLRDRSSFAFALVSIAAALDMDGKKINNARLAMGGVAHKPWRLFAAEEYLKGKNVDESVFRQAASIAMKDAKSYGNNAFKLKLAPQAIISTLNIAANKS
jgi:xanthine dehydrogenase YagS FAD-binding subunit